MWLFSPPGQELCNTNVIVKDDVVGAEGLRLALTSVGKCSSTALKYFTETLKLTPDKLILLWIKRVSRASVSQAATLLLSFQSAAITGVCCHFNFEIGNFL